MKVDGDAELRLPFVVIWRETGCPVLSHQLNRGRARRFGFVLCYPSAARNVSQLRTSLGVNFQLVLFWLLLQECGGESRCQVYLCSRESRKTRHLSERATHVFKYNKLELTPQTRGGGGGWLVWVGGCVKPDRGTERDTGRDRERERGRDRERERESEGGRKGGRYGLGTYNPHDGILCGILEDIFDVWG